MYKRFAGSDNIESVPSKLSMLLVLRNWINAFEIGHQNYSGSNRVHRSLCLSLLVDLSLSFSIQRESHSSLSCCCHSDQIAPGCAMWALSDFFENQTSIALYGSPVSPPTFITSLAQVEQKSVSRCVWLIFSSFCATFSLWYLQHMF